jgi:kynureninase
LTAAIRQVLCPHEFSEWGVDFAAFCGYKYMNGGPGCPAFLYVNQNHFDRKPLMAGWFGYDKQKQFDMSADFVPAHGAGGWQISSPVILGAATLEGSLRLFEKAGMHKLRAKSLALTGFFIDLVDALLPVERYHLSVVTPREPERRGGHIALSHPTEAWRITEALKARGVIPDFRTPDVVRFAPVALYNTFEEVFQVVQTLKKIMDKKEYKRFGTTPKVVS